MDNMNNETAVPRVTVLVCSCDKYSDIWQVFFTLFKKNWSDCRFPVVLNTESKTFEDSELKVSCYPMYSEDSPREVSYGERMLHFMSKIDTPYTLVMVDDAFVGAPVDTKRVDEIIGYMDEDPCAAHFCFDYIYDPGSTQSHYRDFVKRPQFADYKANLLLGLWRTDIFRSLWLPHESPWQWEEYASIRASYMDCDFYSLRAFGCSPIDWRSEKWSYIEKGRWVKEAVQPMLEANGIEVDFSVRGISSQAVASDESASEKLKKRAGTSFKSLGTFRGLEFLCFITLKSFERILSRLTGGRMGKGGDISYLQNKQKVHMKRHGI